MNTGKLAGRTLFITGASRGIGKAIALKAARDGANIVVAAKTAEPHPKLPGTIFTAAEEIEKAGGKALPCVVDVRDESQIQNAINKAVDKFGGIDILINNASAISLTSTLKTEMKRYDLMHSINTRGTFLVSKLCLPFLAKSNHAHIMNISPPLNMSPFWFKNHVAYTMAKYGMSMCVLGMAEEFRDQGIAVNALWPRTAIQTAAMDMLAGPDGSEFYRKADIMSDSAYAVLCREPKSCTGNFFIDDEVLTAEGLTDADLVNYACVPANAGKLMGDFFLDTTTIEEEVKKILPDAGGSKAVKSEGKIAQLFTKIEGLLSEEIVKKTQAVFQFNVEGEEKGVWFLDLKNGAGKCGQGAPPTAADATLTMKSNNFVDMFAGKLQAPTAFMTGKLKISGDMQKAMKLSKLMSSLKSKV